MSNDVNNSDFPAQETERLLLRPLTSDDTDFVFQHFGNPQVYQYLLDEPPVTAYAQAEEIVQFYLEPAGKSYNRWVIGRKAERQSIQPIGTCGFHKWDKQHFRAEIGYDLSPDFWGQGYMREALEVVLAHGFGHMGLHRIEALVYVENLRSIRLLQKLGFKQEGVLQDCYHLDGKFYDHALFALLR